MEIAGVIRSEDAAVLGRIGALREAAESFFAYDAENKLIAANKTGTAASYAYDGLGRRDGKVVNGVATYFLSADADEIAEYDGAGTLLRRYVPGPAIDRPIAMVDAAGTRTFFHQDKTGSVIAMSDTAGNRSEGPYLYDVFGNGAPYTGVPFKFTGRRLDPETGLYYYRARYYTSALGRFLQTDAIGYADDINWYTYVGNDPTDKTDPSGNQEDPFGPQYDVNGNLVSPQTGSGNPPDLGDVIFGVSIGIDILDSEVSPGPDVSIAGAAIRQELKAERAARLQQNIAKGKAAEAKTASKLPDATRRVTLESSSTGRKSVTDFVQKDKTVTETKSGQSPLSQGQKDVKADIDAGRPVIPRGENAIKAGLEPGKNTIMKCFNIDRPC